MSTLRILYKFKLTGAKQIEYIKDTNKIVTLIYNHNVDVIDQNTQML